jgi:hypothetical protein
MKNTRKSFWVSSIGIAALSGLMAAVAFAAHPHFVGEPTFTVTPQGALEATGSIAGLGNQDVTIILTASGQRTCTNQGGNQPPGQIKTVSGSVSDLRPENGRVNFDVVTSPVPNTCPDHMASTVTFTNAILTVIQGGQTVLEKTFSF